MQRREFMQRTALGAVAVGVGATVATAGPVNVQPEKPMQRIVDTHVHLWDLNRFRLPWLEKPSPLARNHVIKDFQTATDGLNVVKGVYMEVDVDPKHHNAEADYVLDICRQGNTQLAAAVIGGRA